TRVGEGPFPTEDLGDEGNNLRIQGDEFGSTTGRPRRCGWFDLEIMKYSRRVNGLTSLALTKLDVLSGFKKIKVAVAYEKNGKKLDYFPSSGHRQIKPVYVEMDGWQDDISTCRSYDSLPSEAREYVNFIRKSLEVPISVVSVGPDRENTFVLE
ncbi:MAG TPA: adenylosuccinate synthase, partial [Spirochaetes bacterium]|nr:adenylosuccinate synthase [Spirochaetota bacterium]